MTTEQARFNLIEQQIRPWDVLDPTVLANLMRLHREDFVPLQHRTLAFADIEIPLNASEKMLTPKMQARICQEVQLTASDVVVEVGTGSGYLTALMAAQCQQVQSYEIDPALAEAAKQNLKHTTNALVINADGLAADYLLKPNVIVFTGSLPVLPKDLAARCAVGTRVFAILGEAPAMRACRLVLQADGSFSEKVLFETVVAPLRNAPAATSFRF
jgi:protein-L-isoaspartate(D-aspartate) O-methyltransferase